MSTPEIVAHGHLFPSAKNSSGYWLQGYKCTVNTMAGNISMGVALVPKEDEIEIWANWPNTVNGTELNCFYGANKITKGTVDSSGFVGGLVTTFKYNEKFGSKSELELIFDTGNSVSSAARNCYNYHGIIVPVLAFDNIIMSGTAGSDAVTDTIQLKSGDYGDGYLRIYGPESTLGKVLAQGVDSSLGTPNMLPIDKSLVNTGEENVKVGSTREVAWFRYDYSYDNFIPATSMFQQFNHTVSFVLEGWSKYGTIQNIDYYYSNGYSQLTAFYSIRLRSAAKALLTEDTKIVAHSGLDDFYTINQPMMFWNSAIERDEHPTLAFSVPFILRSDPATHPIISDVIFRKFDDRTSYHNLLLCDRTRVGEFLMVTFNAKWFKGNCQANFYIGDTRVKTVQLSGQGNNQFQIGPFTHLPVTADIASHLSIVLNDTRGLKSDQPESTKIYLNGTTTDIGPTLTAYAYTPPSGTVTVNRALSSGVPDPFDGTYMNAVAQVLGFSYKSPFVLNGRLRTYPLTQPEQKTEILLGTSLQNGATFTKLQSGYDITKTYAVELYVFDTFGYTFTTQVLLASGEVFMDFRAGGHGLGIGMRAAEENEVNIKWNTNIIGNLLIGGHLNGVNSEDIAYSGSLPGSNVKAALDEVAKQLSGSDDDKWDAADILYLPTGTKTVKDKLDEIDTTVGNVSNKADSAVTTANDALSKVTNIKVGNSSTSGNSTLWVVQIPLSSGKNLVIWNLTGSTSTPAGFSLPTSDCPYTLASYRVTGDIQVGNYRYAVGNPDGNATCRALVGNQSVSGTGYYNLIVFGLA